MVGLGCIESLQSSYVLLFFVKMSAHLLNFSKISSRFAITVMSSSRRVIFRKAVIWLLIVFSEDAEASVTSSCIYVLQHTISSEQSVTDTTQNNWQRKATYTDRAICKYYICEEILIVCTQCLSMKFIHFNHKRWETRTSEDAYFGHYRGECVWAE